MKPLKSPGHGRQGLSAKGLTLMKHHALLAVIVAGSSLPILGGCSAQPQHQVRLIEPEFSYRQAELRGEPVEVMAARGPAAPTGMASRREASAPFTRVP